MDFSTLNFNQRREIYYHHRGSIVLEGVGFEPNPMEEKLPSLRRLLDSSPSRYSSLGFSLNSFD